VEVLSTVLLAANLGELATKRDLEELEQILRRDMEELEQSLRQEIKELELRLDARFEALKGEQTLLKWMLGLLLGSVVALVLKAFFPL
jgi:molybdopterin converting factor small subunit